MDEDAASHGFLHAARCTHRIGTIERVCIAAGSIRRRANGQGDGGLVPSDATPRLDDEGFGRRASCGLGRRASCGPTRERKGEREHRIGTAFTGRAPKRGGPAADDMDRAGGRVEQPSVPNVNGPTDSDDLTTAIDADLVGRAPIVCLSDGISTSRARRRVVLPVHGS